MASISTLSWTAPALIARAKTVTRQGWALRTARQFHAGQLVTACAGAARPVATIRLVADPVFEALRDMPDGDYEAEGWRWLYEHPEALARGTAREDFSWAAFERWRSRPGALWVVRFEVIDTLLDWAQGLHAESAALRESSQAALAALRHLRRSP